MSTNAVTNNSNGTQSTKPTNSQSTLDKDAFLKILVTQLQNQDPTQPLNDREFIAQMAQFSTLEQMNNLSQIGSQILNNQALSTASLLVGKKVSWMDENDNEQSGTVSYAKRVDNQTYLGVNQQLVDINQLTRVDG